jgi:hypothetical protein
MINKGLYFSDSDDEINSKFYASNNSDRYLKRESLKKK